MAPAFVLPDQSGKPVSLLSLRGKWVVLYFYPRDDTPGCTVEACEFTALRPEFDRLGAEVLGCSPDAAAAHTKFIGKHRLELRLLTDLDRAVMKAYGAYGKKVLYGKHVEGVIRSTVLIGPDGVVAHHWGKVKAAGHAAQVSAKLAELRGEGAVGAKATSAKAAGTKASAAAKRPARKKVVRGRAASDRTKR